MLFNNLPELNSLYGFKNIEYGYLLINYIVKTLGGNFYLFVFLSSFFILFLLIKYFSRLTNFPIVALLVYSSYSFLEKPLAQLRSAIAISLIMVFLKYIKNKKFLKYISGIFLASMFHVTSILYLVPYFISNVTIGKKMKYLFIIVCVFLSRIDWIKTVFQVIPTIFLGRFQDYFLDSYYFGSVPGITIRMITSMLITVVFIYFETPISKYTKYYNVILSFLLLTVFFRVGCSSVRIFARVAGIFDFMEPIALSLYLNFLKNKNLKVLYILIILIYSIFSLYGILKGSPDFNKIKFIFN